MYLTLRLAQTSITILGQNRSESNDNEQALDTH